jgi:hypothetical protein
MICTTERDYRSLLEYAFVLEHDFSGYLSSEGVAARNKAKATFDGERRAFVYALFKEGLDPASLVPAIVADLDRMARDQTYDETALAFLREQLIQHIKAATRQNSLQRFVLRWGPPTLVVVIGLAYAYLKLRAIAE